MEDLLNLRKKYLYPTKTPYYEKPLHLVKAQGSYVWDQQDNRYLDVIGGIVSISVGHNHPRIKKRRAEMVANDAIQHTTFLYLSGYMEKLGQKLAQVAPGDLAKSYFTNSGSEANEMAVLSARVATQQQTMVALRHGYHGGTSMPMALCGHGTWKYSSQPSSNIVHAQEPNCYRCPFKQKRHACNLECAEDIKNVIETATCGKIAGFICEPVLGVGGFIDPPLDYHKRAFEIVKSFGGKYISDEVQTGVGRTGKYFFAIEESGVTPDIISFAKGFGSGAAIGGIIAKQVCAEALRGKLHFNTFGGDPYQSMQASEVIDIVRDESLIENAFNMGNYLREGFLSMQADFPIIGDVRGRGLLVGLEIVEDPKSKKPFPAKVNHIMELACQENLLIGKGGLNGNVIRITPSLDISREQCDEVLAIMKRVFAK